MIEAPSPNHDARPGPVTLLLLHYTGMVSGAAALERLRDPSAKVSAHYLVEEDGRVFHLVPEDRRAWHAGLSLWAGEETLNGCSIGIEIVNPGHEWGYRDFPQTQIAAVTALCRDILTRHRIAPARVLGHSDVAPARKEDPGERFPWEQLAAQRVGLFPPSDLAVGEDAPELAHWQADLAAFGYGIAPTGLLDRQTQIVTRAFQRHFEPEVFQNGVPGVATARGHARLTWLLREITAKT